MAGFAPFGFALGFSPMLGDDEEESLVGPASATPTTDWPSLVRAGYQVVRAYLIEGIPYVLGERKLYTVRGTEAAAPDNYTVSAGLMVVEGDASSIEADRQSGLASGRARDLVLRRDTLTDEGLLATLFKTPTWRSRLSAAVTDPTSTVFTVSSTTGVTTGLGYIGRELVRIGAVDSTHLAGLTRGLCGLPHYHRSSAASGYSEVTDVPTYWIGRWVIEYEHLVSPEGRFLGDTWCQVGTYCRESWKGFVDELPKESPAGKVIRCLPLVRVGARKIGAKITGHPGVNADRSPKLYWQPTDVVQIRRGLAPGTLATGPAANNDYIQSVRAWVAMAVAGLGSGWSGNVSDDGTEVYFGYTGGVALRASPRAWFLKPGEVSGYDTVRLRCDYAGSSQGWLVVWIDATEDATVDDVPERGLVRITIGDLTEVAAYDGTHRDTVAAGLTGAPYIALRLVSRCIGGTPRLDPWTQADQATVSIVSGYQGTWAESFRAMMTSSGLGSRGLYDVLGFGFGLSVPEEWIDIDSISGDPMGSTWVDATMADDTTVERTLCGWLAIWGKCLVQRRNSAGKIVLAVVDTVIAADPTGSTIAVGDVLLGGSTTPELLPQPNIIEVDTGDGNPKVIPRDRSRMNAEGDRRWTLRAAGATPADVAAWGATLLSLGDGQTTQELELLPGTAIEVGEARRLTAAHPTTYDTASGAYAPASIEARCLAVEVDRWTEVIRARFLLAGQSPAPLLLCPSARVLRISASSPTDTVEIADGAEARFAVAGRFVYVYEPGNEATRRQLNRISSWATNPSRLTLQTALPSWVSASTVITFYSSVLTGYMYASSTKLWR